MKQPHSITIGHLTAPPSGYNITIFWTNCVKIPQLKNRSVYGNRYQLCFKKWSVFSCKIGSLQKVSPMVITSDQPVERKFSIGCTVTTYSTQFAPQIFKTVSNRLLDVNRWHRFSDSLLPVFKVVDGDGAVVNRPVQENDLIRIAPVSENLNTNDFFRVESVEYENDTESESEVLTIGVSRMSEPFYKVLGQARLLMDDAVTTFRVFRKGLNITAELLNDVSSESDGNKKPVLGVYRIQWRSFINGILTDLKV